MNIVITESQLKRMIGEQSEKFPIFNNTNQTATGKEKAIADKLRYWLPFLVSNKYSYEEKLDKKSEILSFFSPSKIGIQDDTQKNMGLNYLYTSADDWFESVILQTEMTPFKYKTGIKYFSLDENGKITNMTIE